MDAKKDRVKTKDAGWLFRKSKIVKGPVSAEWIKRAYANGALDGETMVSPNTGKGKWVKLKATPLLPYVNGKGPKPVVKPAAKPAAMAEENPPAATSPKKEDPRSIPEKPIEPTVVIPNFAWRREYNLFAFVLLFFFITSLVMFPMQAKRAKNKPNGASEGDPGIDSMQEGSGRPDYLAREDSLAEVIQVAKEAVILIRTEDSVGSGFIVDSNGLAYTNTHVVGDESTVDVILNDGTRTSAYVERTGAIPLDIAIIDLDGGGYSYLEMADSRRCREGEEVLAIGAPNAFSSTVTKGIISNCSRVLNDDVRELKYIQTDAAISPGSSGGPLINRRGEVIAMATGKFVAEGTEGIGFGIPAHTILDFEEGLLDDLETKAESLMEKRERQMEADMEEVKVQHRRVFDNLNSTWMDEYKRFFRKVEAKVINRSISVNYGRRLLREAEQPPLGYTSVGEWLSYLSLEVVKEEMTMYEAEGAVKEAFVL